MPRRRKAVEPPAEPRPCGMQIAPPDWVDPVEMALPEHLRGDWREFRLLMLRIQFAVYLRQQEAKREAAG